MAAKYGSVWAIDIGNDSLKALHLTNSESAVEVIGFENIRHGKILNGVGVKPAERNELIALSLRQFVRQNDIDKDDVIVSMPSQNSFARFVNLPPVEEKRIPEIVKFEAAQQIPFDINEVQWDWQLMSEADEPEKKVGIFAIKNDVVHSALEHFSRENIPVAAVQMAPMALYNYILYDHPELLKSEAQAIVILNIGAENTDLVVCTNSTVWQRCVPMGGNAFTRAIADAFKINFEKAEKLKRTAAMSKYARQIFQAMKPVFTDIASEIQRSLGFYTNSNPDTKLSKVIALGGGTKMRGLLKYLGQSLQMPIERPDEFGRLSISSSVSAAKFHEVVSDFGIVYGLALQGLGLGRIESNLLPRSMARSMAWISKARYFYAAACMLLLVSVLAFARMVFDKANYSNRVQVRQKIDTVIRDAQEAGRKLKAEQAKATSFEAVIQKAHEPFKNRDIVPLLYQTILSVLPNEKNNPEQADLYKAFANGDVEAVKQIPRKQRKQIFITNMSIKYADNIATTSFDDTYEGIGITYKRGKRRGGRKSNLMKALMELRRGKGRRKIGTGGRANRPSSRRTGRQIAGRSADEQAGQAQAGFLVSIAGSSPYEDIGELLHPTGAEDDQSRWGIVNRLMNLDQITDANSPFKLYDRTEIGHFRLDRGSVDSADVDMPPGIGQLSTSPASTQGSGRATARFNVSEVLVDPMTKEIISATTELDENGRQKLDISGNVAYQINDKWFRLDIKFVWKDAPRQKS